MKNRHEVFLGYATSSWKSGLVMLAFDWIAPWKRPKPFTWPDKLVIASLGGLGDLIIQLPLLAGVVEKCHREGREFRVALRPPHAEIGKACGWPTLSLENPLQYVFNRKINLSVLQNARRQISEIHEYKNWGWIDLTGNAFNAASFYFSGIRQLASKTTRGGRSFISHEIPHQAGKNEYTYQEELAQIFGVERNRKVYERLRGTPSPHSYVVLAITTGTRWRSWPLASYLRIIRAFPNEKFILVGDRAEIPESNQSDLSAVLACHNVQNRLNREAVISLCQTIATAKAVISNDSAPAHIARAFNIPGVVLFGPTDSAVWSTPEPLKIYHDQSCPYYPCGGWTCRRPRDWCLEKIRPENIIAFLSQDLSFE